MALQGAEILFYPTAIGSEPQDYTLDSRGKNSWPCAWRENPLPTIKKKDHWETVMRGHAGANLVPLVASNRIGVEHEISFYGCSFIADHHGKVLFAGVIRKKTSY